MNTDPVRDSGERRLLAWCVWLSILLISDLPDISCSSVLGEVPPWLLGAKVGFLVVFLGLCLLWESIRPLRPYAFVMLVFFAALAVSEGVRTSDWWKNLISETEPSFALGYLRPLIRDIGVALAVILALWIAKRRRSEFFLVKGQLNAPIEPVRWLGIRQGESWRRFGWIFSVIAAVVVAFPTLLVLQPSPDVLLRAAASLPAVLLFAAVNAFNEEIYFRASLLATLPQLIGKNATLLVNAAFFGLAHYLYGSPPGAVGMLMTAFLAWLLGKSMLETKGLFWPWFMHFLPDVVIFYSYAIGWVRQ